MTTSRVRHRLVAAVFCALLAGAPSASALPPGGGNTVDTAGTSTSISPGDFRAGDTLAWNVAGFPAGVTVNVKIDDGDTCPASAPQGACVVAQVMSGADGTASGTVTLPGDLSAGSHWLRFLATGPAPERLGYSARSTPFQVVTDAAAAAESGGGAVAVPAAGAAPAGGAPGDPAVVVVDAAGAPVATANPAGAAPAAAMGATSAARAAGVAPAAGSRSGTTGSTGSTVRAAAPAAARAAGGAAGAADGLTPYANASPVALASGTSDTPWAGIVAVAVSGLVAVAMLTASVLVTRRPAER